MKNLLITNMPILRYIKNLINQTITDTAKTVRSEEDQLSINEKAKNFSLYQFYTCFFCMRVRRTINKLDIPIEYHDVLQNSDYRNELLREGGATQVPCLRIEEDGETRWMYESKDIVDYLERHFGRTL